MKLLADECCDALLVAGLRADGHDVLYVMESMQGAADEDVLKTAADQQRILLTEDKDFGELVVRLRMPAYGIVLLRMGLSDGVGKLHRLREVLQSEVVRLPGSFVVVEAGYSRFRPLTPP